MQVYHTPTESDIHDPDRTHGLNLNSHDTGNFTPLTRQERDGSSQSEIRDHTTEWHAERPLRPGIRAGSVTGPWIICLVDTTVTLRQCTKSCRRIHPRIF
ncbi:hypothetical protein GB937_003006 [Aspergillus fischeri]|nr:hypothetical protein GB937_003006 [Aspergillus fischeri]